MDKPSNEISKLNDEFIKSWEDLPEDEKEKLAKAGTAFTRAYIRRGEYIHKCVRALLGLPTSND